MILSKEHRQLLPRRNVDGGHVHYLCSVYLLGVDPYVALPIVAVLMFGLGALIQSTLITPSLKTKSFTNLLFLTVGLGLLLTNGAWSTLGSTLL